MAGKVEAGCPSPRLSLSPSTAMPYLDLLESHHHNFGHGNIPRDPMQYIRRTVSSNDASSSNFSIPAVEDNLFFKWDTAMQCKQHVGTREWIYCEETSCQQLRDELHHLLECPYKIIGGCGERCIPLKKELQILRNSTPKYPTISHTQIGHRHYDQSGRNRHIKMGGDEIQAKLQALNIEEYVATSGFSPNSPAIDEPFQSLLERNHEMDIEEIIVPVVELVPLDKSELSVINGCFRKGHEWIKLSFLGKGTFGTTYLCYDKHKNSHFAIKKLPVSGFDMDEVKIWQRLSGKHLNILTLYGAVERKERVLIFMEFVNGGSVSDYLAKYGHLSEKMALQLLHQVLCGLEFMHKNCIVHGDVKAANVLMDDLGVHVKLADFGSCVDLRSIEDGRKTRLTGTLAFMAPEVCRSEFPSTSSDIWSAMCFLIQMLSGNAPWNEYRHQHGGLLFVIGSAKRPPLLPLCSEAVQEMFAQGLNVEARCRPSAAELIRHRAFNFDDSSTEVPCEDVHDGLGPEVENDDSSVNDDSLEYHSSHSPLCSDLDLSDEEYFSSTDDVDNPGDVPSSKAKSDLMNIKILDKKGGLLEVADAKLTVPANALQDSTRIGIRCVDPVHFYQPLIDNNLYEQVHILGHVHQLSPAGQRFRKPVSLKVSLPEELHQSEDITVFHGSLNKSKNSIAWKDITSSSNVLPFKDSTRVTLTIEHFSRLIFLKTLSSLTRELLSACFNFQAMLFRFLILVRRDPDASGYLDVCVVVVRESFHSSSCSMESVNQFCICQQLKDNEGYRVMYGSRREYIFPKEQLELSVENSSKVVRPCNQPHVVQCLFGGEVIGKWRLDASFFQEPLSGMVSVKRSAGQVYRFQFWEHEPTRYVQDVLNFVSLTHTNMIPLAKAIGLDQDETTKLIEETPCDEEEQLKKITECWERKAENSELTSLENFVDMVPKEELLVSHRGKFHLGHLNHFSEKWNENNNQGEAVIENELFLRKMAENGKEICQSILSDCFLQIDHCEDAVRLATDIYKSVEKVIENVGQHYPQFTSQLLNELMVLFASGEGNQSTTQAHLFCRHLSRCIPWIIQIVKDLFKVHATNPPTGMWGLFSEVSETDAAMNAQEELPCNEVWCQICEVLKKLCERNLWKVGDDVDLDEMERTLDVNGMLTLLLSLGDKEWNLLIARVKYFRHSSKEITRNRLSRISGQDLQNVLQWLQRYVAFCPTRLVQFTPKTSGAEVVQRPLLYCQESKSFTQTFCLTVEADSVAVEFAVKTDINGHQYSEIVAVPFEICEGSEEQHHESCTTLNVVYKHNEDGTGSLKISNDCQKVFLDHIFEGNTNQIDGGQTEETTTHEEQLDEEMAAHRAPREEMVIREEVAQQVTAHVPEMTNIKEGSPSEAELHEIARKIPKEWKQLGRRLLSTSAVEEIDEDERQVAEKATKMLEKWKKSKGSCATYEELFHALCSEPVSRKDIADEYCVTMSQEL